MTFIRVKSANKKDPQHEFYVDAKNAGKERYKVVDATPVAAVRPALYVTDPVEPEVVPVEPAEADAPAKKAAKK